MGDTGLKEIEERIAAAATQAGRADPVTLVVVVKYASDSEVAAVIDDGARHLGESRADALVDRADKFPDVEWHFVGRVQGRKVRLIRPVTDLLHSMDRLDLADYWSKAGPNPPPVLIQVNLASEPQKAGVTADEVLPLVDKCVGLGISVRGLMTIPPRPEVSANSARWFSELRDLRDVVAGDHPQVQDLSMGMTADFAVAIAEGATILRVGRAIFEPSRNEG